MLRKDLIVLELEGKTSEEVLRNLSAEFVKTGVAKPTYPDALVEREKKYPTALPAVAFDIAVPHTFKEYINEPAIGIGILKNKVQFQQMGSPEIALEPKLLFMLAITDPNEQIALLKKIMMLIQDEKKLNQIRDAGSSEEIYELLSPIFN
ncbi:MAG: PTS sugar transporter subunit IIA [Erysipelotrichia bacterium]|nr:PTS sugar transporter subunit IIA [Erysipelotrichia bacterium]